MVNYTVLEFSDIWNKLYKLVQQIKKSDFRPDVIVCIARGGFVVGRILSDLLQIKELASIGVTLYKGINETSKQPEIYQDICYPLEQKKVLLVDDVADTGKSLDFVIKYLSRLKVEELKVMTIHYKPHSIIKPDFYLEETSDWLVYPWELVEFSCLYYNQLKKDRKSDEEIEQALLEIKVPFMAIKEMFQLMKEKKE